MGPCLHQLALSCNHPLTHAAALAVCPQVVAVVIIQFIMAYAVRDWAWWKLWIAAYVISGTLNQNLFCAQVRLQPSVYCTRSPVLWQARALCSVLDGSRHGCMEHAAPCAPFGCCSHRAHHLGARASSH